MGMKKSGSQSAPRFSTEHLIPFMFQVRLEHRNTESEDLSSERKILSQKEVVRETEMSMGNINGGKQEVVWINVGDVESWPQ